MAGAQSWAAREMFEINERMFGGHPKHPEETRCFSRAPNCPDSEERDQIVTPGLAVLHKSKQSSVGNAGPPRKPDGGVEGLKHKMPRRKESRAPVWI